MHEQQHREVGLALGQIQVELVLGGIGRIAFGVRNIEAFFDAGRSLSRRQSHVRRGPDGDRIGKDPGPFFAIDREQRFDPVSAGVADDVIQLPVLGFGHHHVVAQ